MAAIVQGQNACLWHRMSWVRSPLAAPNLIPTFSRVRQNSTDARDFVFG